jgi:hypothetical protein
MTENIDSTPNAATGDAAEVKNSQEQQKTFTQSELNDILAKRIAQVKSKYETVDLTEYQELKTLKQQVEEEQLIKRNEFEKLLKQTKARADEEATKLRGELEKIKVDGALISAASKSGSVNPEHIAHLLRTNVRLTSDGQVNVVDADGNIRYTESADPMGVNDLVEEFLSKNTYYRVAGPAGAGSSGNTENRSTQSMDLSQLDLSRPDHRELYRKMKQEGKI